MGDNTTSEEISSHKNSAEVIDHTCNDDGINLLNKEEELDGTYIHSINATNDIFTNNYDNHTHKYYATFLSSSNY